MARPAAAALALAALAAACAGSPPDATPPPAVPAAGGPVPVFTGGENQMEVTLFFLRADGEALAPETRRIFRTATINDRARQALQALLGGSEAGLLPSVPPGTTLNELYLTRDGTAYVDLGPEFAREIERGSSDAVPAVYALVNTLSYNFPEILKVKILVEGDEVDDLGGHLDLSRPLLPEMGLVSTEPSTPPPADPNVRTVPDGMIP
jgi:spore germination protein GerM